MMWQDLVFMIGSSLSIAFLAPTLRDASARVPLGTSVPSMTIGIVYGITFATLGMTFSALGAFVTGTMWSLVAIVRSPVPDMAEPTRRERLRAVGHDLLRSVQPIVASLPILRTFGSDGHDHNETGQPAD